jgi:hypothetical protein
MRAVYKFLCRLLALICGNHLGIKITLVPKVGSALLEVSKPGPCGYSSIREVLVFLSAQVTARSVSPQVISRSGLLLKLLQPDNTGVLEL